jgi:hypothetical protein
VSEEFHAAVTPPCDLGLTEEEVRDRMERYYQSLRAGRATPQTGE